VKRASLGLLPRLCPPKPPCIPPRGITWPREAPPGAKLPRLGISLSAFAPGASVLWLSQAPRSHGVSQSPQAGPLPHFPVTPVWSILFMGGHKVHPAPEASMQRLCRGSAFLTLTCLPGSSCARAPSDQTCSSHRLRGKTRLTFTHAALHGS
jgi:hypothetical protein